MKYCSHCGAELVDEAIICPKCGCATELYKQDIASVKSGSTNDSKTLQLIAKIFMIISCICTGFAILPLAWTIPMTVVYCRKIREHEHISVAFKVCTLLFVSNVAGILMLCDNQND